MGMTDAQFKAYNRQLLEHIKEIKDLLKDGKTAEAEAKAESVAKNLQTTIEETP